MPIHRRSRISQWLHGLFKREKPERLDIVLPERKKHLVLDVGTKKETPMSHPTELEIKQRYPQGCTVLMVRSVNSEYVVVDWHKYKLKNPEASMQWLGTEKSNSGPTGYLYYDGQYAMIVKGGSSPTSNTSIREMERIEL